MSTLKKNFFWNSALTLSGYVFPLFTFPYITRVLGAENFGKANFAMSIVDYAILFSTLGLATIGFRYIPQCNDDKKKREDVFNHLVTLHILLSAVILVIYIICVLSVPQLSCNKILFFVGGTKIIFNVFLVEWLFQGMQDFKYITLRTLFTRILYVLSIFVFVKENNDYDVYFYLTVGQLIINAIINWRYTRKFVSFKFRIKGCKEFLFPVFSMGVNRILLSFYVTFNIIFLEIMCGDLAVGYFSTATRLYTIFLSFLNAYNGVFVPYLNNLYGRNEIEKFKQTIKHSFSIVGFISIPLVFTCVTYAPEIIRLTAGSGYNQSVLPFRIIIFQIFFIGLSQILENQILLSIKKFKEVLICTSISTLFSILILFLFTAKYAEIAAAYAVAIPHFLEMILLFIYARKSIDFKFPINEYVSHFIVSIPIIFFCILLKKITNNYILTLLIGCTLSGTYYLLVEYYIVKQQLILSQINLCLTKINSILKN